MKKIFYTLAYMLVLGVAVIVISITFPFIFCEMFIEGWRHYDEEPKKYLEHKMFTERIAGKIIDFLNKLLDCISEKL